MYFRKIPPECLRVRRRHNRSKEKEDMEGGTRKVKDITVLPLSSKFSASSPRAFAIKEAKGTGKDKKRKQGRGDKG